MNEDTRITATIQAYFAAIRAGDRAAWLATFAPDIQAEDPAGSPIKQGLAEMGAFFDSVGGALKGMDFHPVAIHPCGRRAAVFWQAVLEAHNGLTTACDGIDFFEFDGEGKISRVTGFWDPAAAFAALGLG